MAKNINRTYKTSYFCGVRNINFNLIACEDKIYIASTLQSYVLNLDYLYLLLPIMDIPETIIRKILYWYGIRNAIRNEVNTFYTY